MKQVVIRNYFIITIALLYSCQKEKPMRYYPESLQGKSNVFPIEKRFQLDERLSKNLKKLLVSANDSIPYFVIEDDSTINFVELNFYGTGHYRTSLALNIYDDSIYYNGYNHISKIDSILPKHYFNDPSISSTVNHKKNAFVTISIDTSATFVDLKLKYGRILSSYKKTIETKNDTTQLLIKWIWLNFRPPPPPPPPDMK